MLVIKLAEADRHFTRAGARSGDNYQLARGFDIIVFAVALVAYYQVNVGGIIRYCVVVIYVDAVFGKALLKLYGCGLFRKTGKHHRIDAKTASAEDIEQAKHVQIICNAQVTANLVFLDVGSVDYNNDFSLVLKLHKHLKL